MGGVTFDDGNTIHNSWQLYRKTIGASDDLDDLRDDVDKYGIYSWGGTGPANAPLVYGILFALNDSNQGNQMCYGNTNQKLYLRRANSGTWTSWAEK